MTSPAKKGQSNSSRRSELNIIYFVDSAKTRSLKIPLTLFNFGVMFFALLIVWSFTSCYFLYDFYERQKEIKDSYQTAMASLFDYQSRYDRVFELTYLEKDDSDVARAAAATKDLAAILNGVGNELEKKINTPDQEPLQPKVQAPTPANALPTADQHTSLQQAQSKPIQATQNFDQSTSVKQIRLKRLGSRYFLKFQVHNAATERAEGFAWALGTLADTQNNTRKIGAPQRIGAASDGTIMFPRNGERFSIRNFRTIELSFRNPDPSQFSLVELEVGLMDSRTLKRKTVQIPVPETIRKRAPQKPKPKVLSGAADPKEKNSIEQTPSERQISPSQTNQNDPNLTLPTQPLPSQQTKVTDSASLFGDSVGKSNAPSPTQEQIHEQSSSDLPTSDSQQAMPNQSF